MMRIEDTAAPTGLGDHQDRLHAFLCLVPGACGMSAESRADKALVVAAATAAVVAIAAFGAMVVFGYLACFTSGARADHYFNAAWLSMMLTAIVGVVAAGLFSMAAS